MKRPFKSDPRAPSLSIGEAAGKTKEAMMAEGVGIAAAVDVVERCLAGSKPDGENAFYLTHDPDFSFFPDSPARRAL